MRDAVEKTIGDAVARDLLAGGTGCGTLDLIGSEDRLSVS
jgi:hypothetical protein